MENAYFYDTEVGKIYITDDGKSITGLYFGKINFPENFIMKETDIIKKAINQLNDYFSGKRRKFDLPLAPCGTDFQKTVWRELQNIPYGETRSYKEIAEKIGRFKAFRAVGHANNKNPIPIFIPCHRVIGADGSLVGYGGGIEIKKYLLDMEKKFNTLFIEKSSS